MKKGFLFLVFFLAFCALNAQNPFQSTATILDKTAKKYDQLSTFSLDFKIELSAMDNKIHSFIGKLWVKKEKYYLTFEDQIMANDGQICWNYQQTNNEVTLFDAEDDEFMMFHPTQILNNWSKDYSAKWIREEKLQQKTVILLDLTPKKKTSFNTLRLFIDKETSYIQQIVMSDENGMSILYSITKFTLNTPISDEKFVFNKKVYPNVQISDMR
ncbi:MAG: outer membrane lipoprotein carrier protein LolA [Bacteroidales bacterium]|jgi:outer membrane lipoprotein-sorting protein|nr:outer membrane lipoprotein carrier protein LolA [Bacteroidales bacterium]